MRFLLLMTQVLRIWFMQIFARPKKTHETRTRWSNICTPGLENLTTFLLSNFGLFAQKPKSHNLYLFTFLFTQWRISQKLCYLGATIRSLKHDATINYTSGWNVWGELFLAVNHHNHKNWVPSILTHNFWLIFMGMKQKNPVEVELQTTSLSLGKAWFNSQHKVKISKMTKNLKMKRIF